MLRTPKREPKGYVLQEVTPSLLSSDLHTPDSFPRVTQSTLGIYCRPIDFEEKDIVTNWKVEPMHDKVLDKYTKDHKAWWVDKPGKDTEFLHGIYQKYNVQVNAELDFRYKFNPRIFQRSFKYETDSMEATRQELIARKVFEDECQERESPEKVTPDTPEDLHHKEICKCVLEMRADTSEYNDNFGRWQNLPRLFASSLKEPCARRRAFQQFKQPFKHEACNWYHVNYPPPNIPFRPGRFI